MLRIAEAQARPRHPNPTPVHVKHDEDIPAPTAQPAGTTRRWCDEAARLLHLGSQLNRKRSVLLGEAAVRDTQRLLGSVELCTLLLA